MVNAGALSHYSWASARRPGRFRGVVVRSTPSNPAARTWRTTSVVAPVADEHAVAGFGGLGYRLAVQAVARLLAAGAEKTAWRHRWPCPPPIAVGPTLEGSAPGRRQQRRLTTRDDLANVRYLTGFSGFGGACSGGGRQRAAGDRWSLPDPGGRTAREVGMTSGRRRGGGESEFSARPSSVGPAGAVTSRAGEPRTSPGGPTPVGRQLASAEMYPHGGVMEGCAR